MFLSVLFVLNWIVNILIILIIARAVLSWIPEVAWRYREITRLIERVVDPILEPFRQMLPPRKTGGIDLSPALAIIVLQILMRILTLILLRY